MTDVIGYQGWDYTIPPNEENCECKRPQFGSDGVCYTCHKTLKGTTLKVDNVTVDASATFRIIQKNIGE